MLKLVNCKTMLLWDQEIWDFCGDPVIWDWISQGDTLKGPGCICCNLQDKHRAGVAQRRTLEGLTGWWC